MTSPSTVVIGHLDIDRIETNAGIREGLLGGSALYTALAASINQSPVGLVGTVCSDYPHHRLSNASEGRLEEDLVQVLGSQRRNDMDYTAGNEGPSDRVSHGYASETWQQKSEFHAPRHVPKVVGPETTLIHLSAMLPMHQRLYAEWALEHGCTVSLDTSAYCAATYPEALRELVEEVDLVLFSDTEVAHLYPEFSDDPCGGVEWLVDSGPDVVVVRQGEDGCLVGNGESMYSFDARPTTVVDPTGAGDSFNGAFVSRYHTSGIIESCQYGIATATRCVEAFGNEGLLDTSLAAIKQIASDVTYERYSNR